MKTSKFENFDSARNSKEFRHDQKSFQISDIFKKPKKSIVSNLKRKEHNIKEDFAEVKKEIRQEENNIKKGFKEIGKSIRQEEHNIQKSFHNIDRKKLIILLKLTGILLSLLIVGIATFYLITDSYFWYIYLIFFSLGSIFVVLFFRKDDELRRDLSLKKVKKREEKNLKKLLRKIDKKERQMFKKLKFG